MSDTEVGTDLLNRRQLGGAREKDLGVARVVEGHFKGWGGIISGYIGPIGDRVERNARRK